jgi:2',3'-cyclic-nucleotide 2'-phosphodiesterase (5'-nucleotidase family)
MKRILNAIFAIGLILSLSLPASIGIQAAPAVPAATVTFTILHTNDFHGNLEPSGSNPGAARVAQKIEDVRTAVGADNLLVFDAGDIMQSSLLSNLQKGLPTIDYYKQIGYNATTLGNHEFDWGQAILADRALQAADSGDPGSTFPMVAAISPPKPAVCAPAGIVRY